MRKEHLVAIGSVLCIQGLLVFTGGMSESGAVAIPFLLLALLFPIPAYFSAFRNVEPGVKSTRRGVRVTILSLVAVGLSVVGFLLCMLYADQQVRSK